MNNIIDNSIIDLSQEVVLLEQIHADLGIITSFIALSVLFALFYVLYKAIYNLFNV